MDKKELIKKLNAINGKCKTEKYYDEANGHIEADYLLLEYINDSDISEAFKKVYKWYS